MNIFRLKKEIISIVTVLLCSINLCYGGVDEGSRKQLTEEVELLEKMESRLGAVSNPSSSVKGVGNEDFDDITIEVFNEISRLRIIKKLYEFDIYLYSVKAEQVQLAEILGQLAFAADVDISFPMVEPAIMRKEVDVSLSNLPLQDILEVVTGIYGLEFVLDEDLDLKITIPSNIGFNSAEDYFKYKIVKNFRKALIKYPEHDYVPESHFKLGNFFDAIGQKISATQEFMVVAERYPKHVLAKPSLKKVAKCLAEIGDLKKARDVYNQFIDRYPNDESLENIYWEITNIWYEEGKYHIAISLYKKILEMYPWTELEPKIHERMAASLMKTGKFVEAFDILVELKEKNDQPEQTIEIDFMIGECLYRMGRPSDAFVLFSSIVDSEDLKEDKLSKVMLMQAESLYKMDKCVEAIEAYKKWVNVTGEEVHGMLSIGKCLRQLRLFSQAAIILENAMVSNTDDVYSGQIRFELAMNYYNDSQYDKAIKLFTDISMDEDSPQFVDSNFYGAESLFVKKEYKDAIPFYEKLVTLLDEDVDRLRHVGKRLALCYQNLGLYSKALNIYKADSTANN